MSAKSRVMASSRPEATAEWYLGVFTRRFASASHGRPALAMARSPDPVVNGATKVASQCEIVNVHLVRLLLLLEPLAVELQRLAVLGNYPHNLLVRAARHRRGDV